MTSKTYRDAFRITLPSNANRTMYPDNLAGKFTVELPVTIQLEPNLDWEVCLEEMFWPIHGDFINPDTLWMNISGSRPYEYVNIPAEHLTDFSTLIRFFEQKFKNVLQVKFDEILEIVTFTFSGSTGDNLRLELSNSLARLLGYNINLPLTLPKQNRAQVSVFWVSESLKSNPLHPNHALVLNFEKGFENVAGNQAPSLYFPSQFLHVYCNLTESTYFNGKLINSLRVIRLVQKKIDKYVRHIAPKQLQFFEVTKKTIDRVDIELRDDQNRLLRFPNGSTIVNLYFRPRHLSWL